MGVVCKTFPHLSSDKLQQVFESDFPSFLLSCLELIAARKDSEIQGRAAVHFGASAMSMAVYPCGKELLLQGGALNVLSKLSNRDIKYGGRDLATSTSCAHALLVGREEDADIGLTQTDMDRQ